jgi:plasmid stabilization system protein ParE
MEIYEYISRQSPQNAADVLKRIFDTIDSLDELPHRYKVHRSNKNPERVIRSVVVWPYIVYCRIDDRRKLVEIQAVIHGARRQPRRFE